MHPNAIDRYRASMLGSNETVGQLAELFGALVQACSFVAAILHVTPFKSGNSQHSAWRPLIGSLYEAESIGLGLDVRAPRSP